MAYSTVLTPEERTLRARAAAHAMHAAHDPRETTQAAREAFHRSFEEQVDPDGTLPPEERARRVEHARKAFYARLAFESLKSRRLAKAREAHNARP
jgi:hypothetical protein